MAGGKGLNPLSLFLPRGRFPCAQSQLLPQVGAAAVLLQQVAHRLFDNFRNIFHLVLRQNLDRIPGVAIETDSLTDGLRTRFAFDEAKVGFCHASQKRCFTE